MVRKPLIAIHGGAGTITKSLLSSKKETAYLTSLSRIIAAGQTILSKGGCALDAVTTAVCMLEDNPLFNAGKGAVFTHSGKNELDAAIMDGATLNAGAVAGVSHIRNPILAAKAVLNHGKQVLLIGKGAEVFAAAQGIEMVDTDYFFTQERYDQLQAALAVRQENVLDHDSPLSFSQDKIDPIDPKNKLGTVGAVALDSYGNLAAATSTGGLTNKVDGRVGDSPIIGAGCYANNSTVAVSATGTGEMFIRGVVAYDISALMEYAGLSLEQASRRVVMDKLPKINGQGGIIAIDHLGNIAMPFNTEGMYRGFGYVGETPNVAIYKN